MSALGWLWTRLTPPYSVPTPIPAYIVAWLSRFWTQSAVDRLWQLLLVVVGGALLTVALTSGYAAVAAIAGIILSILLTDDIRQTVRDVWSRNFWIWRVDP